MTAARRRRSKQRRHWGHITTDTRARLLLYAILVALWVGVFIAAQTELG